MCRRRWDRVGEHLDLVISVIYSQVLFYWKAIWVELTHQASSDLGMLLKSVKSTMTLGLV